ncbi:MAG: pilus assembly protein [Gammaproteobacteria bacterium]
MDDVVQALYEMDLRPDLVDPKGKPKKNNIETYMIGFADEQAKADPLMQDTAKQGGGLFIQAENSAQLSQAFQAAIADISGKVSSAASVALNSGSITSDSHLYQAKFNISNWSGQLLAFPIKTDGTLGTQAWDAAVPLNAQDPDTRKIVTFKPSTKKGIRFRWPANPASPGASELDPAQVSALHANPVTGLSDTKGSERLDYLRGKVVSGFRIRGSKLGDSVYSSPAFVGAPMARYPDNWGPGEPENAKPYSAFKSSKTGRAPMVYVGANDGMLHGFDAKDGSERFAYVPASVFKNLNKLTDPNYNSNHRFYVDDSPIVSDAFFGGSWHTVLVGGLRGGGQGIYALDVTSPPAAADTEDDVAAKVLWELTDATYPELADLGYSYSDPSIVRLHNGKWAVVFGNGYNNSEDDTLTGGAKSTSGNAVLYIVDVADGSVIAKIDTKKGYLQDPKNSSPPVATDPLRPNGLATPAPIDANGDYIVDYVYAGDLFGNLWKFDVNKMTTSQWDVDYGSGANPAPLFTACFGTSCTIGATSNYQPITTRPEVGRHPTQPVGQGECVLGRKIK